MNLTGVLKKNAEELFLKYAKASFSFEVAISWNTKEWEHFLTLLLSGIIGFKKSATL